MNIVNQHGAVAGGDVVAGDKVVTVNNYAAQPGQSPKIRVLMEKLAQEYAAGMISDAVIEELTDFYKRIPDDAVVGLEAKLQRAGRDAELIQALAKKERFAKLLERWSLYGSAQEIFVHILAMVDHRYSTRVLPQVDVLSPHQLDRVVEDEIITPLIEMVGADVFSMNHHSAMGMIYWLAEQCRVRWHS